MRLKFTFMLLGVGFICLANISAFAEGLITGYFYDPNIGKIIYRIDDLNPTQSLQYVNGQAVDPADNEDPDNNDNNGNSGNNDNNGNSGNNDNNGNSGNNDNNGNQGKSEDAPGHNK